MSSHDRYTTGDNQSRRLTPKMIAFRAYYNDPTSDSFCNARKSALKAGYSESYANNLTVQSPDWMTADAQRTKMLEIAEKNLLKIASMDEKEAKKNPAIYKIWQDTNKFLSERLGKEYYSTRKELTGREGKALFSEEKRAEVEQSLNQMLSDNT